MKSPSIVPFAFSEEKARIARIVRKAQVGHIITYIEELLIGLVFAIGVTNGCQQIIFLVQHIVTNARHVGELHIGIHVNLDDTVTNSVEVLLLAGARATMENEVDRLVFLGAESGFDVSLVLSEKLRVQLDVAWLVDPMDIAKTSGNREIRGYGIQSVVDVEDILGLCVKRCVVDILIIDSIFLATSDANLHFKPLLHGSSAFQIFGSSRNVPVHRLFRKIDHVRAEEGLAVGLEVGFVGVEHSIKPWQKLLSTMIGVQDHGDSINGSNGANISGTGYGTSDGSCLVRVAYALVRR